MNCHAKVLNFPDSFHDVKELVEQWNSLNVSSVYILSSQINHETFHALSEFRGDLWLIIQTFLASECSGFPLAVTEHGEQAVGNGEGSWLRMLCLRGVNSDGIAVLDWRASQIEQLVRDCSPVGISLDFIRHFAFWEGVYSEDDVADIPRSCFCSSCVRTFSETFSLAIPRQLRETAEISKWILSNFNTEWNQFTVETITSSVKYLSEKLKEKYPAVKVNLHLVPWSMAEYNGAVRKIVGQDITELEPYIDQVSPMCYAPMLNRSFGWIAQFIKELKSTTALPVYPAVQVCSMYGTTPLTEMEFEGMLESTEGADGVMIWPWETLTVSQRKSLGYFLNS